MKTLNNNIQESYCSFEVSKLLKEKGFSIRSEPYRYNPYGELTVLEGINCPTHALAIEWIRVNFGVWVVVNFANGNKWYFDCNRIGFSGEKKRIYSSDYDYSSPQEATEVALKYVLEELI